MFGHGLERARICSPELQDRLHQFNSGRGLQSIWLKEVRDPAIGRSNRWATAARIAEPGLRGAVWVRQPASMNMTTWSFRRSIVAPSGIMSEISSLE